ncbi:hypothetical protein [Solibacillus ferritrahens]|uniref:hypothetical protein n=1 Tax=Solibacillus ferritrahens TaxID=3098620 RepID=UPI0030085B54
MTIELMDNVKLELNGNEAALLIGMNTVLFKWTDEAAALFDDLDVCEPVELLSILSNI